VVLEQLVLERLHGLEVPVDDHVEKAVHERADAVLLAAEFVEALRYRVDVELRRHRTVISPRGTTNPEMRCTDNVETVVAGRFGNRVHREEHVSVVDDGLGLFGFGDRVLDRPVVEPEFLREVLEDRVVRGVDVAPHQRVVLGEVVADRRELEVVPRLAATDVRSLKIGDGAR
jgi:predicted methyltransferase MtxX (methanogen marker protein 4)